MPDSPSVYHLADGEATGPIVAVQAAPSRVRCSRSAVGGSRQRRPVNTATTKVNGTAVGVEVAPDPFDLMRVLWAYQEHQPRWVSGGDYWVCLCGRKWGDFCPVLAARLAELGHDPLSVLRRLEGTA